MYFGKRRCTSPQACRTNLCFSSKATLVFDGALSREHGPNSSPSPNVPLHPLLSRRWKVSQKQRHIYHTHWNSKETRHSMGARPNKKQQSASNELNLVRCSFFSSFSFSSSSFSASSSLLFLYLIFAATGDWGGIRVVYICPSLLLVLVFRFLSFARSFWHVFPVLGPFSCAHIHKQARAHTYTHRTSYEWVYMKK